MSARRIALSFTNQLRKIAFPRALSSEKKGDTLKIIQQESSRRATTETDNGNDYAKFLAEQNAAMKEQYQLPQKGEHAKKFLKIPTI
mmetsp:Transcript_17010/g.23815  ORF Transcript_17010/g.23815 Transcript_17010/m.23815 type:complete len:87 (-) Transcript_17010:266-526(-)|eukprot:CAMPEP_0185252626 /NCGR_PEP_ID=MMETSP1359-20130426/1660_1 /TAXON_ID=552665 /ORGANISM="Bigelowiella longifila, Strain CCMP242" /LENGTH=86 /DNA_ID=CAMNT_0027834847 /DNA_START=194 /DNA_END=454 /DNA_ORIENTATION=-